MTPHRGQADDRRPSADTPERRYDLGAIHRGETDPAAIGPFDLVEWERRASVLNPGPFVNPKPIKPPRARKVADG